MEPMSDHYMAYSSAFAELREAMLALRRFIVTLKHLGILRPEEVQPLFKNLQRKYFNAHMRRQILGDTHPGYVPRKKSEN
jgi:hypothetical protein